MHNVKMAMDTLPQALISILTNQLEASGHMTWRVHGVGDKIVMNIMWTDCGGLPDRDHNPASPVS